MKEILYKAKDLNSSGDWVYGDYLNADGVPKIVDHQNIYVPAKKECFIQMFEVDGETVCQYTGMKDRDGKKVFENDILSDVYRTVQFIVCYDYKEARFILKEKNGEIRTMYPVPTLQVIGNKCDEEFEWRLINGELN